MATADEAHDEARTEVPAEREHFTTLVLKNPNYFGNLEQSKFKPVKPIKSNTHYEQLTCVGLSPGYDRLEGIVQIKRDIGYGGTICANGSFEYVRFYVDLYDNGVWHDVGASSVRVHDIPGKKPLCYGVHLDFSSYKKLCKFENIVKVRAILQWNAAPPASTPGYHPVYGNVVDVEVQIRPSHAYQLADLVDELQQLDIALEDSIGPIVDALDASTQIPAAPARALSLRDRRTLYERTDVPPHRYAFPDVLQLAASAEAGAAAADLTALDFAAEEVGSIVDAIAKTDGDTGFEQLRCIGLQPEAGLLEGVVTIKRPQGYGGQLCTKGTTEYVAFWIDFGSGFDYMGTATINVHDLKTIPAKDLQYAVFLKQDLTRHQVDCKHGPRIVHMRAILSWEHPPPPGNPNFVPTWGNREDCLVQLAPGRPDGHYPVFESVGGVVLPGGVSAVSGRAVAGDRPFGGSVTLTGRIGNPPDSYGGGATPLRYRIEVQGPAPFTTPSSLNYPMSVSVAEQIGGMPVLCAVGQYTCSQSLQPKDYGDGLGAVWYDYLEDSNGNEVRFLTDSTLATWNTNGLREGRWTVRMIVHDPATSAEYVSSAAVVNVQVDNTPPSGPAGPNASVAQNAAKPPLHITSATFNGNPVPAVDCGKFPVGTIVAGTFEVRDPALTLLNDPTVSAAEQLDNQHLGGLWLEVFPAFPANGATPVLTYQLHATDVAKGTWTLDTSAMQPCGYVIRLTATDRTIVDNRTGEFDHVLIYDVGFCLV